MSTVSTPPAPTGRSDGPSARSTSLLVGLVKLARPKQWAKNVLVFAAPAAAGVLDNREWALDAAVAFVAFCLAAALTYNLADGTGDGVPLFAPLMLDEAFSKSDETFAAQALGVFHEFGFQLVIAAPIRMSGIIEPFIGQAVLVEKRQLADGPRSNAASATFGQLAARRDEE